ncbi:MAG: hypothetical protein A2Z18_04150, partial [Armatimonadetes bacterium RBG_16_58_9]
METTVHSLEDELGDIVAKARVGCGLTVHALAETVGMSSGDISSIEAYKLRPDREHIERIAESLGLDPGKLLVAAEETWVPAEPDFSTVEADVTKITVPYGAYGENCYVAACPQSCKCAIVDPGGAVEEIAAFIDERDLIPRFALITHAHTDHIGGLKQLAERFPELTLVSHTLERDSVTRGTRNRWEPAKDRIGLKMGSLNVVPLATPGHTQGSCCYLVDGVCFLGDTLFAGS